jgi:hypothetical protein
MRAMDRMPKTVRALVHEYGLVIVARMREAGYNGAQLKNELKHWRHKRQEHLLR